MHHAATSRTTARALLNHCVPLRGVGRRGRYGGPSFSWLQQPVAQIRPESSCGAVWFCAISEIGHIMRRWPRFDSIRSPSSISPKRCERWRRDREKASITRTDRPFATWRNQRTRAHYSPTLPCPESNATHAVARSLNRDTDIVGRDHQASSPTVSWQFSPRTHKCTHSDDAAFLATSSTTPRRCHQGKQNSTCLSQSWGPERPAPSCGSLLTLRPTHTHSFVKNNTHQQKLKTNARTLTYHTVLNSRHTTHKDTTSTPYPRGVLVHSLPAALISDQPTS